MKFVYLVYFDYEEFKIFSSLKGANKFIDEYSKKNFKFSGLYNKTSGVTGKKYNIKDFIKVSGLKPIKQRCFDE